MTRLESSAWPLAGGCACVFGLAIVLDRLPWQAALAVVLLAVAVWAWYSPLVVGAALGVVAWMCVTGFDVHHLGHLTVTGRDDAARAAVLVVTGVLVAAAHAVAEARAGSRRTDPVWDDFHATGPSSLPADVTRPPIPRQTGAVGVERWLPADPTEEPIDG